MAVHHFLRRHPLIIVLFLAVGIRIGALLVLSNILAFERTGAIHGSSAFDTYAQNLLATGVYGREAGVPDALFPPLYSYALAVVYEIFGRGYLQVGMAHILLDLASIVLLFQICKRLFPDRHCIPLLAILFYALYPYLVFHNLTLIDTPFFMFWLHLLLWLMILMSERMKWDGITWLLSILGGLALGMATLVRPILLPLTLFIFFWFWLRCGIQQALLRLLPVAVVSLLILTPWIMRNYRIYDTFVPMTTNSGGNFWQGNHEDTARYLRAGYDVHWTRPSESSIIAGSPQNPEVNQEHFALGWEWLRANPDKIPELLWVKFWVHWSIDVAPRYNPSPEGQSLEHYDGQIREIITSSEELQLRGIPPDDPIVAYQAPLFDVMGRTLHRWYFGPLLLLAILGVALSWREWRRASLLWAVQVSMTLVYVAFHPATRYRAPSDPLLFVFSAIALCWLWERGRELIVT